MKKGLVVLGMTLVLGMSAIGCGGNEAKETTQETAQESASFENAASVTGVIDEVADYYFSILAEDGVYYQFPFTEDNSIDLSEANIGDTITLYYEGELSDLDMFDGVLLGSELAE